MRWGERIRLIAVILAVVLSACANPTPPGAVLQPRLTTTEVVLTTTTMTTVYNPYVGRPQLVRFGLVRGQWEELGDYCTSNFGAGGLGSRAEAACYDALESQKGLEFEGWLLDAEASIFAELQSNSPGYNADQYGCHDDGRCLDDGGAWCDIEDVIEESIDGRETGEWYCG